MARVVTRLVLVVLVVLLLPGLATSVLAQALPPTLEGRTVVRLAAELPAYPGPARARRPQLPRVHSPRLHPHPAPAGIHEMSYTPSGKHAVFAREARLSGQLREAR